MGVTVKQWKGAWWLFVNHRGQRKAKRVGVGDTGKKAAKEAAQKLQARLALGGPVREETETPTLAEYAPTWLKSYASVECKPRTYELYDSMLRLHILPTLGSLRLSEITRGEIRKLLAAKAEPRTIKRAGKDVTVRLKRSTLKNILAPLREMLNHAVEDRLIAANPAARLLRQRASQQKNEGEGKRVDIFTEKELAHLLAMAEKDFPKDADFITTAAWSGMRQGEALGLQWPDLDSHNGFVEVRRTVGYRKGKLNVGSPKSGKARRVDLPKVLLDRLSARYEKAKEDAALNEKAFCPWVFPNRAGQPQDASHFISRVWHPLLEKAELRRVPFHTLRHTYASLLIMRGENLAYIKEQLGHSSIQVTVDLYGHLIPGIHRGAVDALAEATKCNPGATEAEGERQGDAEVVEKDGGPCRDRTCGPLIKSQLLYQLS